MYVDSLDTLILRDMPSIELSSVFNCLPELKFLKIDNVDSFTAEAFKVVFSKLLTYNGIHTLALELLAFDIE